MSDVVERLHTLANESEMGGGFVGAPGLVREAADEIERLREALTSIRDCTTKHGGAAEALRIIDAALKGNQ